MKVTCDYREPSEIRDIVRNAVEDYGGEFIIGKLFSGDFLVDGNNGKIVVERKTVSDYLQCLQTGRLSNQLYNMSANFDISYLVTVGYFSLAMEHTQIKRSSYISSLVRSSLKRTPDGKSGIIHTLNLETTYDFSLFISMLGTFLDDSSILRIPQLVYSENDKLTLKAAVFTAIPGVSEERGKRIIKHFKSLKRVFGASIADLEEVHGIGETTATSVYNFLHEDVEDVEMEDE